MASEKQKVLDEERDIRTEATIARLKSVGKEGSDLNGKPVKNNLTLGTMNKTGYFSQDNVKAFTKAMATRCFAKPDKPKRGRGGFFDTPEELEDNIMEYFSLCADTEVVPTISALACWLQISRDDIYNHLRNPNSIFADSFRKAVNFCHMCLENGASESKINSVAYIFQAKNYFGMKDTQEVHVQTPGQEIANAQVTLDALRQQKEQENSIEHLAIDMQEAEYEEIPKIPEE